MLLLLGKYVFPSFLIRSLKRKERESAYLSEFVVADSLNFCVCVMEKKKKRRALRQKNRRGDLFFMRKANNLISKGSFVFLVSSAPSTRRKFGETNRNVFQAQLGEIA